MSRTWRVPEPVELGPRLLEFVEAYRAHYLEYFIRLFEAQHCPEHRGGYYDVNSVSGQPYGTGGCYSWSDGRVLGELCASVVAGLEDAARIRPCAEHLSDVLQERHRPMG